MVPRLREMRPAARGGQDAGITQPRDNSLADPCIYVRVRNDVSPSASLVFKARTCLTYCMRARARAWSELYAYMQTIEYVNQWLRD